MGGYRMAGTKEKKLTPRQARFVSEYLLDLNATQAAKRAGFSVRTAKAAGSRLLTFVAVAAAISEGKKQTEAKTGITRERVLAELELLAFSDVSHYLVSDAGNVDLAAGAPNGAMRAISAIKRRVTTDSEGGVTRETEVRLWNKPEPLKLAGKHVGLFIDKNEEPAPTNIVVYAGMRPPDATGDEEASTPGASLPS